MVHPDPCYTGMVMKFAGQVVAGKVIFDGDAPPEGTKVVVRTVDANATFEVTDSDAAELSDRIRRADLGDAMDARQHLRNLQQQR